jgi:hypothetical protein
MAEETVVAQSTTEVDVDTQQTSPEEQLALDHGWRPKEEWDGNPDDWIPAKEFNFRGELYGRIAKYGHELKEHREALRKMFDQHRKLYDAGYSKAVTDLKADKLNALEENDARKAMLIDDEIDALKEQHQAKIKEFDDSVTPQNTDTQVRQQVLFDQWNTVNGWYNQDPTLRQEADMIAKQMVSSAQAQGKTVEYAKLLTEVARQVKSKNPDKFPKAASKTSAVDGGSREVTASSAKAGGKFTLDRIPVGERDIAQTIIKSGALTEEEYVKQYVQANRR